MASFFDWIRRNRKPGLNQPVTSVPGAPPASPPVASASAAADRAMNTYLTRRTGLTAFNGQTRYPGITLNDPTGQAGIPSAEQQIAAQKAKAGVPDVPVSPEGVGASVAMATNDPAVTAAAANDRNGMAAFYTPKSNATAYGLGPSGQPMTPEQYRASLGQGTASGMKRFREEQDRAMQNNLLDTAQNIEANRAATAAAVAQMKYEKPDPTKVLGDALVDTVTGQPIYQGRGASSAVTKVEDKRLEPFMGGKIADDGYFHPPGDPDNVVIMDNTTGAPVLVPLKKAQADQKSGFFSGPTAKYGKLPIETSRYLETGVRGGQPTGLAAARQSKQGIKVVPKAVQEAAGRYKSPEELLADYQAGKIDYDTAIAIGDVNGW